VAKFTAGVVDTGGKFATGVINTGDTGKKFATGVLRLDLRISPQILDKIQNGPNVIFRSLGKDDS
jgi:hypothetical protein